MPAFHETVAKRLPTMPETRWLYEVVIAAVAYRDATRAAISKVRLHPDTERAYDRAAAKLDGALNELRLARRGEVRGTVTDTKGLRK